MVAGQRITLHLRGTPHELSNAAFYARCPVEKRRFAIAKMVLGVNRRTGFACAGDHSGQMFHATMRSAPGLLEFQPARQQLQIP